CAVSEASGPPRSAPEAMRKIWNPPPRPGMTRSPETTASFAAVHRPPPPTPDQARLIDREGTLLLPGKPEFFAKIAARLPPGVLAGHFLIKTEARPIAAPSIPTMPGTHIKNRSA